MQILRTEKQRDNLAKFFWDMAKVAFTFFVLAPLAQAQSYALTQVIAGLATGFTLVGIGYMLDGRKVTEGQEWPPMTSGSLSLALLPWPAFSFSFWIRD
jgi:hypothetical protein